MYLSTLYKFEKILNGCIADFVQCSGIIIIFHPARSIHIAVQAVSDIGNPPYIITYRFLYFTGCGKAFFALILNRSYKSAESGIIIDLAGSLKLFKVLRKLILCTKGAFLKILNSRFAFPLGLFS